MFVSCKIQQFESEAKSLPNKVNALSLNRALLIDMSFNNGESFNNWD